MKTPRKVSGGATPSHFNIQPERTRQVSVGLNFPIGKHSLWATFFDKSQDNIPFFKYAQSLFSGVLSKWENYAEWGNGKSRGGEFLYEYENKDFYTRIAYTLSKTTRFGFPSINNGNEFHSRFDRTHVMNAIFQWRGISATLSFQSGNWENGAPDDYEFSVFPGETFEGEYFYGYNHYRMPMVFRLDLGWNKIIKNGRWTHDIRVGICNVTNHFNPFMLYYDAAIEQFKAISLLPIMPNFCYRIGF